MKNVVSGPRARVPVASRAANASATMLCPAFWLRACYCFVILLLGLVAESAQVFLASANEITEQLTLGNAYSQVVLAGRRAGIEAQRSIQRM